ncbi:MAG: glutaredoxin domain-containing protein, partial [Pseudomonadota bacterium]
MADVTIYTRDFCGYCTRAVALLRSKGVEFT